MDGPTKKKINWPNALEGDVGKVNGDSATNTAPIIDKIIPRVCILGGFLVMINKIPRMKIDIGNQNKSSAPGWDARANMYRGSSQTYSN